MVLARPQRAHSPLGVDAGGIVHAGQIPAAPILRTGPRSDRSSPLYYPLLRSGSSAGWVSGFADSAPRSERTCIVDDPLCDGRPAEVGCASPTVRRLRPSSSPMPNEWRGRGASVDPSMTGPGVLVLALPVRKPAVRSRGALCPDRTTTWGASLDAPPSLLPPCRREASPSCQPPWSSSRHRPARRFAA